MIIPNAISRRNSNGDNTSPFLDLANAGQDGFIPELGKTINGVNYERWISNTPMVTEQLVCVCLRAPKLFDVLADRNLGNRLRERYIALMTYIPKSITGLSLRIDWETAEEDIGGSGLTHEVFTKATRQKSVINRKYIEKMGMPIFKFIEFLGRYGVLDPDSQTTLIRSLDLQPNILDKGDLLTPDYYTGSFLYFEPDALMKNVVKAWVSCNEAAKTTGDNDSQRVLTEAKRLQEYDIEYTGIVRTGESYNALAQAYLDRASIFDTTPDKAPTFLNDNEIKVNLESAFGFNRGPLDSDLPAAASITANNTFVN